MRQSSHFAAWKTHLKRHHSHTHRWPPVAQGARSGAVRKGQKGEIRGVPLAQALAQTTGWVRRAPPPGARAVCAPSAALSAREMGKWPGPSQVRDGTAWLWRAAILDVTTGHSGALGWKSGGQMWTQLGSRGRSACITTPASPPPPPPSSPSFDSGSLPAELRWARKEFSHSPAPAAHTIVLRIHTSVSQFSKNIFSNIKTY